MQFSDLGNLTQERIDDIKRKGSLVIKDVVDDDTAAAWKSDLEVFVKANPDVPGLYQKLLLLYFDSLSASSGIPEDDKQFFHL